MGAHIVFAQQAVALERDGEDRLVRLLDGSELRARTVVIATGIEWRRLGVPRLEALVGSGVFYGAAVSESRAMRDQDVFIVGAGNSAGQAALHLAKHARAVTLLVRGDSLASSMSNLIGGEPHTHWLPQEIARDHQGYIATGRDLLQRPEVQWERDREPLPLETSMPGVFAAGDVRQDSIKRVASAVGDGATVVRLIHEHLREYQSETALSARSR